MDNAGIASLNQSLSNNYHSGGGASRRTRPIDTNITNIATIATTSTTSTTSSNTNNNNTSVTNTNTHMNTTNNNDDTNELINNKRKRLKKDPDNKLTYVDNNNNNINSNLIPRPSSRLIDLAGIDNVIDQIKDLVFYPIKYPELYTHLGVRPPCGILLNGPSGCGKTLLAYSIAGELDLPFYKATGPELIGGTSGESESRVREIFELASSTAPSILFIDGIDVIAGKRDSSQRGMDKRIISQLCDSIDSINNLWDKTSNDTSDINTTNTTTNTTTKTETLPKIVILLAATNKTESIDPSVRGRFSKEISLPVPDAVARAKILKLFTANKIKTSNDVDIDDLGRLTPGFVGADLKAMVREAGMLAACRIIKESASNNDDDNENNNEQTTHDNNISIDYTKRLRFPFSSSVTMNDFTQASKTVQPSAKREGFAVVPDVTWNDVGALTEIREELFHNILEPIAHPEKFRRLGLDVPAGVLFFGPPGCGKTLLAKAIANQSGANFISVKGPELLNMYVGESESKLRQVFSRARASAPCVIFFDELDALVPKRGSSYGGGNNVSERIVNQFLTELDGLESRKDVYIIAATNRLELIDDAMLRPGRLGKLLYVPLPSPDDRYGIFKAVTRKVSICIDPLKDGVDLHALSVDIRTNGFSGADCAALIREAGLAVIKEWQHNNNSDNNEETLQICSRHIEVAYTKVKPSVSSDDQIRYTKIHECIKQGMSAIQALNCNPIY